MIHLVRALLGLPPGVSPWANGLDWLHASIIGATMLLSSAVALVALVFVMRWRTVPGTPLPAHPAPTTPRWLELSYIGIPLSLFLVWWWIGFRQFVAIQDAPPADEAQAIYVTAKQWMWEFAYPDGRASIGVLVVPSGTSIRLVMVSRDVIHGFFVPAFRLKHDVVPGRVNLAWFRAERPGIYDLWCSQYCGLDHSRMRGLIVALDPTQYGIWRSGGIPPLAATALAQEQSEQPAATLPLGLPLEDLASQGLAVAARHGCLACHTTDGQRHIGPTWLGMATAPVRLTDGRTITADEAYLTRSMMDPGAEIVAGYTDIMPSFQGRLEPGEVGALLALMHALAPGGPGVHGQVPQTIPPLPPIPLPAAAAAPPSRPTPEAPARVEAAHHPEGHP